MEIRRLKADDYDELLSLLNGVFANKYGREMDFLSEQPRMWKRDDASMGKHIAVFEDGRMVSVVGIYPLPVFIGNEKLNFATTGNVATLPEYEGRGYFTKLFSMAMEEVKKMGIDVARLGGARQRYARFGFEPSGLCFKVELNSDNVNKFFKEYGEGVDRMCRELEVNGSIAPVFHTDDFILKVTVKKVTEKLPENNRKLTEKLIENPNRLTENKEKLIEKLIEKASINGDKLTEN